VPEQEIDELASKIKPRRLSEMFGLLDGYSVTKTREEARVEVRTEVASELLLELMEAPRVARIAKLPLEKVLEIQGTLRKEGRLAI
jgi:hypothetical protein